MTRGAVSLPYPLPLRAQKKQRAKDNRTSRYQNQTGTGQERSTNCHLVHSFLGRGYVSCPATERIQIKFPDVRHRAGSAVYSGAGALGRARAVGSGKTMQTRHEERPCQHRRSANYDSARTSVLYCCTQQKRSYLEDNSRGNLILSLLIHRVEKVEVILRSLHFVHEELYRVGRSHRHQYAPQHPHFR